MSKNTKKSGRALSKMNTSKETNKHISLDIVWDYPVNWSFKMILRDLIQNFYDAVGPQRFSKEVLYDYELDINDTYTLTITSNIPFNYEWLIYIGGSTKTRQTKNVIGKYGEGFKIATLCLLRDFNCKIKMESQDWCIRPVCLKKRTDFRSAKMLGYDLSKKEYSKQTLLRVENIPLYYKQELDEALLDFYYPENPLLSKSLCDNKDYAIYTRSNMCIPCDDHFSDIKGIFYYCGLARGRLSLPLIIVEKNRVPYIHDTRSREVLDVITVQSCICKMANSFSPSLSYRLLIILKDKWDEIPKARFDEKTDFYFICQLVRNVADSNNYSSFFKKNHPDLVYIDRPTLDHTYNHLLEETKAAIPWLCKNRNLVSPIYRFLGAVSLVEEYCREKESHLQQPTKLQCDRFAVLWSVLSQISGKLTDGREMPGLVIGTDDGKLYDPLLFSRRVYGKEYRKHHIKYVIQKLLFYQYEFDDCGYEDALVKMGIAMCHTFVKGNGETLTALLTELGSDILKGYDCISWGKEKWNA